LKWAALDRMGASFGRTDWRVWAIFAALFVVVAATGAMYALGLGLSPDTNFGAVFASWVGGVALFAVAGTIVAIVSLVRPEHESFDARARILFRRQSGRHIDYAISRIKEVLEHYAEATERRIVINEYDEKSKKLHSRNCVG
jgi:hypothetical protein